VDNNPRQSYDGRDLQLEKGIEVLEEWLKSEPILFPKNPGPHVNMSLNRKFEQCNTGPQ
jgi:hypothetical protein